MRCSLRVVVLLPPLALFMGCRGSAPVPRNTGLPAVREGHVAAGGGVRLFYRMVGSGHDTVVVLHGGPGFSMDYFADDLTPLAERHALLFYDQRGTGRSTLVSDSAALDGQRFAEDLEAVRRHFGIGRLTLLGHSWGAGVAALYAARYPERVGRLLVVGPIPARRAELEEAFAALDARRDSVTRRRMQEWRQARRADPGDAAACRAYYVLWFSAFYGDPAAAGRSKGDFCAGSPEARRNKIASVDRFVAASLGAWDWLPSLRALTAPALVIHGTADPLPVPSARQWAAALPNGRLLLLQGVGHFPYVEVPDRFFAAVEEFLLGRWPTGAQPVAEP